MSNLSTSLSIVLLFAGLMPRAHAFSLIGPYAIAGGDVWQVIRLGYNEPPDIGGPMNVAAGEEYRWNTPDIFYAYDAPFLDFFGTRGMEEVEKAVKIINDLPPASLLNVNDYPMTGERINFRAAALGLWDLRSTALSLTLEEMGLASPERWVYCLRNRGVPPSTVNPPPAFFNVIRRNFDPVTAAESPYINGRLWTYIAIFDGQTDSITINQPVDPLDFGRFDPVSALRDAFSGFSIGSYFTGLTRDDVGAIKYAWKHKRGIHRNHWWRWWRQSVGHTPRHQQRKHKRGGRCQRHRLDRPRIAFRRGQNQFDSRRVRFDSGRILYANHQRLRRNNRRRRRSANTESFTHCHDARPAFRRAGFAGRSGRESSDTWCRASATNGHVELAERSGAERRDHLERRPRNDPTPCVDLF